MTRKRWTPHPHSNKREVEKMHRLQELDPSKPKRLTPFQRARRWRHSPIPRIRTRPKNDE